ncbi:relaxase/mobilization nuclease domain-containing protein [[Clostridium] fimetarium]|uniref:Relaxase/Mobilisation nuclease domain-containing protein n=1 Tax=[Clostridium] fimetarium TaxID=99656 RepID=A0A1I0Q0S9_9FIRM|nr:relaxase/mobilization nuclease domain-containing protein [[Clostridium] fimetarium]SEW20107.1 Relaxase/Mobilisation nuclease domain-containing protein [[Clostridium] fimetarium]
MANLIAITDGYKNEDAVYIVLNYMWSPYCDNDLSYRGNIYSYNPYIVANQYMAVQKVFMQERGKRICHMVIGFENKEINYDEEVLDVMKLVIDYFKDRFQVFAVIHNGSKHRVDEYLHIHITVNTVSYVDGSRLYDSGEMYYKLKEYLESCSKYNWALKRKKAKDWPNS